MCKLGRLNALLKRTHNFLYIKFSVRTGTSESSKTYKSFQLQWVSRLATQRLNILVGFEPGPFTETDTLSYCSNLHYLSIWYELADFFSRILSIREFNSRIFSVRFSDLQLLTASHSKLIFDQGNSKKL